MASPWPLTFSSGERPRALWVLLFYIHPHLPKSIVRVIRFITNRKYALYCIYYKCRSDCHLTIYPESIGIILTMYRHKWLWLTVVELSIGLVMERQCYANAMLHFLRYLFVCFVFYILRFPTSMINDRKPDNNVFNILFLK